MPVRAGINGFGRIGRLTLRTILQRHADDIEVVAINDLTDVSTNAHLFKWDSTYGPFNGDIATEEKDFVVNGKKITVFAEREPGAITWVTRSNCGSRLLANEFARSARAGELER